MSNRPRPSILPLSELGKNAWVTRYLGRCTACTRDVEAFVETRAAIADEPSKVPPATIVMSHGCATPPNDVVLVYSGPRPVDSERDVIHQILDVAIDAPNSAGMVSALEAIVHDVIEVRKSAKRPTE